MWFDSTWEAFLGSARGLSFGHGYAYVHSNRCLDVMKVWCRESLSCLAFRNQKPYAPRVLDLLGYVRNVGGKGSNPVTSTAEVPETLTSDQTFELSMASEATDVLGDVRCQ